VLSDGFPGDWLPLPAVVRLRQWPAEQRKRVKRARWITTAAFERLRSGASVSAEELAEDVVVQGPRLRTTLDRLRDATGAVGSLFSVEQSAVGGEQTLSVYARVRAGFEATLQELFGELARTGFGADVSSGFGELEVASPLVRCAELDRPVESPDAVIVLSTFQPGVADPADGAWECLVKYGKLGPDFGVAEVFKRPLVMLRPGACLRTGEAMPVLGRAIGPGDLLAPETVAALEAQGARPLHLAFGLGLPARLGWQAEGQ